MAVITPHLCITILITLVMIPNSAPAFLNNVCPPTMFMPNSNYQTHLQTVFHSLESNTANPTGFFTTSAGNSTSDVVHGLFLCRGDQNATTCHTCVTTATSELQQKYCPNRTTAIIWYDECMVRYSNESLVGKMDLSPNFILSNTQDFTGNVTQFTNVLLGLLDGVSNQTANGGPLKKFGTGKQNLNDGPQPLYALAQCTPDLSDSDCYQCLSFSIVQLPKINIGARFLTPSCSIDYEMYPPFNGALSLSSPPSPPTNSTGTTPLISHKGLQNSMVSGKVVIAIVLPTVAISLMVFAVGVWIIRKNSRNDNTAAVTTAEDDDFSAVASLEYDFETLQAATNNFSVENKLGEGGFGGVYKGTLQNGQEIAVKRLSKWSAQGIQEFKNEISLIAKLQHRNLVKVLGFCFSREEKLVVYEYVPNKSLDYFIFDPEMQAQLNWEMRCKIIKGIAQGMVYLHEDSGFKIIHRDLKPSNILLDMDMNPKISDFGMAKIFAVEHSGGATSRVVGTYGYMAPEYAMHGKFSTKSDVYSFGVLVLEIISGKRINTFYSPGQTNDLLSFAWMKWRDRNPSEFMDPVIRNSCSNAEVMRYMQLGLLCVQESVRKRPTMATVLLTLETYSVTLSVPEKPVFFDNSRGDEGNVQRVVSTQSSNKLTVLGSRTGFQSLNLTRGRETELIGSNTL